MFESKTFRIIKLDSVEITEIKENLIKFYKKFVEWTKI